MNWTIYTMGDAAFLQQIFTSIAMIMSVDFSDSYETGIKMAMMIGVLMIIGRSMVAAGQPVNIGQLVIIVLLYSTFIVPKTSVFIEDLYDGNVYVVDNVPLGVAFTGHISSSIGYSIAGWFDQGFTPPVADSGFLDEGYLNALEVLTGVRRFTSSSMNFQTANGVNGGDVSRSFQNYITECTLIGVDLDQVVLKDVLQDPNPIAAMQFVSDVYFTEIYTSGVPQTLSCTDAHAALSNYWNAEAYDAVCDGLRYAVFKSSQADAMTPDDACDKVQTSLDMLGRSFDNVNNFVQANVLLPIYEGAVQGKYVNDQQYTTAVMMNQALAQRNTQWLGEQSMFETIFRPMYTFIEGMIYGIAPVMGLLMMLGGIGISLVMKQLIMLCWLQMWLPMLSIANMFIYMSASTKLDALVNVVQDPITSLSGIWDLSTILPTYLSVGSYMAAGAPALAAFLVFGSSVALTNIAGKISGNDHVNEKIGSPDVVTPASLVSNDAKYKHDSLRGTYGSHAEELFNKVQFGHQSSDMERSASSRAISAEKAFGADLATAVDNRFGNGSNVQDIGRFSTSIAGSSTQVASAMNSTMSQLTDGAQISSGAQEALRSALVVGGSAGVRSAAFGAAMNNAVQSTSGSDRSFMQSLSPQQIESAMKQNGLQGAIRHAAQSDMSKQGTSSLEKSLGVTDSSRVSQSAKESARAQEEYQTASQTGASINAFSQMSGLFQAKALSGDASALKQLAMNHSDPAVRDSFQKKAALLDGQASPDVAAAGAAIAALSAHGHADQLMPFIAQNTGGVPSMGAANRNSGITAPTPNGQVQQQVQSGLSGNNANLSDAPDTRAKADGATSTATPAAISDAGNQQALSIGGDALAAANASGSDNLANQNAQSAQVIRDTQVAAGIPPSLTNQVYAATKNSTSDLGESIVGDSSLAQVKKDNALEAISGLNLSPVEREIYALSAVAGPSGLDEEDANHLNQAYRFEQSENGVGRNVDQEWLDYRSELLQQAGSLGKDGAEYVQPLSTYNDLKEKQ